MNAANRVAVNTLIIYGRMVFTIGISLYTTRIVLATLGAEDYGIFNLIGGVILMLSFLNAAMSASTQRFLSYYQGKNELDQQRRVFSNSLLLHLFIALLLVAFIEFFSPIVFNHLINIRAPRLTAAKYVYHFTSLNVLFVVITVPFNATLIAHENMIWVAFVNILETVLKLAIAIIISGINMDKLIAYAAMMAIVPLISLILYAMFCLRRYEECRASFWKDRNRNLLYKLGSFAGWNLFGALCGLGRSQGLAILLNKFFGARINAAYAMSNQVSSQLNFLSATMLRALNPQIMKSEGSGDRERMLRLSASGSKFCFFLLSFFGIPFIFEMKSILSFWLTEVPPHTTEFCQFILVAMMISQITVGLQSAIQATGNIKLYQIVVGSILISTIPISIIFLKMGYPPVTVFYVYCAVEFMSCCFRIYFLRKFAGLSVRFFMVNNFLKIILPVLVSLIVCGAMVELLDFKPRFLFTILLSGLFFTLSFYFCGLDSKEKNIVDGMARKLVGKIAKTKK